MRKTSNLILAFIASMTLITGCSVNDISKEQNERTPEINFTEVGQTDSQVSVVDESQSLIEWITPVDDIDMSGMNLYWQHDNLQFAADDKAKLSIYVRAEKNDAGNFVFNDGQDWLLLMETSFGIYPLFPRKYIQLGKLKTTVFNDSEDSFHVLVTIQQSAGYKIYDCVFNNNGNAFGIIPVYDMVDINFLGDSSIPNDTQAESQEILISVDYAPEEISSDYFSFDDQYDGYVAERLIFSTDKAINDFKFIEIGYSEENKNIKYFESAVLYSLEELLPEKPLVVTW